MSITNSTIICLHYHSGTSDKRDGQISGSLQGFLQFRMRWLDQQASYSSKSNLLGSAKSTQRGSLEEFKVPVRGTG